MARGEECGQKQKEMKNVNLKVPFVPIISLFVARV